VHAPKNYFINRGFNATQINNTVEEVKNMKREESSGIQRKEEN
jgi:hypothetical protein